MDSSGAEWTPVRLARQSVSETDTENEQVLTPFLRSLVERGLDVSQGLLVIVDGGKGLRAAVRKAFRHRALVQRVSGTRARTW